MPVRARTLALIATGAVAQLALCAVIALVAFGAGQRAAAVQRDAETPAQAASQLSGATPTAEEEAEPTAVPTQAPAATAVPTAQPTLRFSVTPAPATPLPTAVPTPTPAVRDPVQLAPQDLELLLDVWAIINQEYDGLLPTEEQAIHGAVQGSLDLLGDPFTRFIPPEIAERGREQLSGVYEGIGAFVDLDERGFLVIVRPFAGQPAAEAGLQPGDVVTHIDGRSVAGKSLEEVVTEVKGPVGTPVTLTVRREDVNEPFDVVVLRARVEIPVVESRMLPEGVAYLRLSSFSNNADERLREALEAALAQEPRALVLDLRDNPGGFLNQATAVADLFLPEGIILYQRDRDGDEEIFTSADGDPGEEIPMVVLVNVGSASASEIVAGAIQDRGRGTILGEPTFGKGSVQQTHRLPDGSELRVTIARWYTPNNISISEVGIWPDVEEPSPQTFGGPADTQLQRAIQILLAST